MAILYACPCCGYRTLHQHAVYDLCLVCFWEDDPTQAEEPWMAGGANGISLIEAQQAYLRLGAMDAVFEGSAAKTERDTKRQLATLRSQPATIIRGEISRAIRNRLRRGQPGDSRLCVPLTAWTLIPLAVVAAMVCTMASWLVRSRPRQFKPAA
jgi:hypothetical protein